MIFVQDDHEDEDPQWQEESVQDESVPEDDEEDDSNSVPDEEVQQQDDSVYDPKRFKNDFNEMIFKMRST